MENRKKGADFNISVRITYPVTIPGFSRLYHKELHNLSIREALSLVERKIKVGYSVTLYSPGDEETFFEPLGDGWQL